MKVVVDTNIVLSAWLGPSSPPRTLLDVIAEAHTLIVSLAMAAELGAVIVRPKFSRLGTAKDRVNSLQTLLSAPHVEAVVPTFLIIHPDLPDPDDNRLLEAAIASQADLIATGDKALLALRCIAHPAMIPGVSTPSSQIIPILSAAEAIDFLLSAETP